MNSRKWTAMSTLLSGAVAAALLAGTFSGGGQKAYASQVAAVGGSPNAGVQVQNLETTTASSITLELFPQNTGQPVTLTRSNVSGEGSANFYLPSETAVGPGAYGAVLTSDRQIAAIARHEWLQAGNAGAATYGTVPEAEVVILPLVLGPTAAAPGGFAGQVSWFSIQNAATTGTVSARVDLFQTGSSTPIDTATYSIGAGTSRTVKMGEGEFTGLPDTQTTPRGFVGYARITGTAANRLVVQSFVDFTTSNKAVYAFSGVPSTSAVTQLYAPLLRRDYFGTTGVSIVNPGTTAASVVVSYFDDPQSPSKLAGGTVNETINIPASSSVVLYQGPRANNPLPDTGAIADNNGWFGSARMVSTQPILAVVNDAVINNNFATQTSAAYNAATSAEGANKIFAPLVRRRHVSQQLTTGIQVQNIGNAATDITVTYKRNDGAAAGSETRTGVQPGRSVNFYQDAPGAPFPTGNFGSAVITSSGQPLALIVNDFSINNALDAALYNGLR